MGQSVCACRERGQQGRRKCQRPSSAGPYMQKPRDDATHEREKLIHHEYDLVYLLGTSSWFTQKVLRNAKTIGSILSHTQLHCQPNPFLYIPGASLRPCNAYHAKRMHTLMMRQHTHTHTHASLSYDPYRCHRLPFEASSNNLSYGFDGCQSGSGAMIHQNLCFFLFEN